MHQTLHQNDVDFLVHDRIGSLYVVASETRNNRDDRGAEAGIVTRTRWSVGRHLVTLGRERLGLAPRARLTADIDRKAPSRTAGRAAADPRSSGWIGRDGRPFRVPGGGASDGSSAARIAIGIAMRTESRVIRRTAAMSARAPPRPRPGGAPLRIGEVGTPA